MHWEAGDNLDTAGGGACIVRYDYNRDVDEGRVYQSCEHKVFLVIECRNDGPVIYRDEGDIHICCYTDRCNTLEWLEEIRVTATPPDGKFAIIPCNC